jgi:N-acetylmuramoyl-L-alanine amidase
LKSITKPLTASAVATSVTGLAFFVPDSCPAQTAAEESTTAKPLAIIIDPGHGGKAYAGTRDERTRSSPNNATSPSGIIEKDLPLELSKKIAARIDAIAKQRKLAIRAIFTRDDDRNLDFARRALLCAKAAPVAAVVSIHFNASETHRANGSVVMIRQQASNPRYDQDYQFATALAGACATGVRPFFAKAKPDLRSATLTSTADEAPISSTNSTVTMNSPRCRRAFSKSSSSTIRRSR